MNMKLNILRNNKLALFQVAYGTCIFSYSYSNYYNSRKTFQVFVARLLQRYKVSHFPAADA